MLCIIAISIIIFFLINHVHKSQMCGGLPVSRAKESPLDTMSLDTTLPWITRVHAFERDSPPRSNERARFPTPLPRAPAPNITPCPSRSIHTLDQRVSHTTCCMRARLTTRAAPTRTCARPPPCPPPQLPPAIASSLDGGLDHLIEGLLHCRLPWRVVIGRQQRTRRLPAVGPLAVDGARIGNAPRLVGRVPRAVGTRERGHGRRTRVSGQERPRSARGRMHGGGDRCARAE